MKRTKVERETKEFSAAVGRAVRRAAKVARKTARMHGTPIYIWKDGKVVAEKPCLPITITAFILNFSRQILAKSLHCPQFFHNLDDVFSGFIFGTWHYDS